MKLKTTIKITQGPMRGHTVEIEKELGPEDTLVDFLSWCAQQEKEAIEHYKALAALEEEPVKPNDNPYATKYQITQEQMDLLRAEAAKWYKLKSQDLTFVYDTTTLTT